MFEFNSTVLCLPSAILSSIHDYVTYAYGTYWYDLIVDCYVDYATFRCVLITQLFLKKVQIFYCTCTCYSIFVTKVWYDQLFVNIVGNDFIN